MDTNFTTEPLTARGGNGLFIPRHFTSQLATDAKALVEWERRDVEIKGPDGSVVFSQRDVEVPKGWSQQALQIVASKYFRGHQGTSGREDSVWTVVNRVVGAIYEHGLRHGYFLDGGSANTFRMELSYLLLNQMMAFNSPVWFNVGTCAHPQSSACFINSVEDSMESILELAKTEARLFKGGSGTGSNLSPIRSAGERLSRGGTASGPVSFMRGFDSFAGAIKSGGSTRRSAKMVILNVEHPDIMEFVRCKVEEERKAWALIDAGYDAHFTGGAYASVQFQNANNSIRATDDFMRAAVAGQTYQTKRVTDGQPHETLNARDVLMEAARAAHLCGDPGVQFDDTIQRWHTCPESGRINASNPCSEYVFLDDSACNLASLNLLKFHSRKGFDVQSFELACRITLLAQEILVDLSSYPTAKIAQNSHDYRPLGLGYANLGALLMTLGMPYDSDYGRNYAAAITSLMHGSAYYMSAAIAQAHGGPFPGFAKNREAFLQVIEQHAAACPDDDLLDPTESSSLWLRAIEIWRNVRAMGAAHGFRNAQVTVLAPTGTIGFMMDCDTTGIEPDIALVKYKRLVGGGAMTLVNQAVPQALRNLGYGPEEIQAIQAYIEAEGTIEGAPCLKIKDLPIFDCAFKAPKGTRSISPMGHIKMMEAVQPFLSGAISKTVNVPESTTPEEIFDLFVESWKRGLKAVAIYRDNSKRSQPLTTKKDSAPEKTTEPQAPVLDVLPTRPARVKLPKERQALTHKFTVGGHKGYITAGLYPNGQLGEIFVKISKEGSTISGLLDTIATLTSIALQHGVPLSTMVEKFQHVRFEPAGFTGNPSLPRASSVVDYVFRWLGLKFLGGEVEAPVAETAPAPPAAEAPASHAPPCPSCGNLTVRAGSCYACTVCGSTTGCS